MAWSGRPGQGVARQGKGGGRSKGYSPHWEVRVLYRIKEYESVFHLSEMCRHKRPMWTRFPIGPLSIRARELMRSDAGCRTFCVFIGALRIAQRGKTNGVLLFEGQPMTPQHVADELDMTLKRVQPAWDRLIQIGWFEPVEEAVSTVVQRLSNVEETFGEPPREEKIREEKRKDICALEAVSPSAPEKAALDAAVEQADRWASTVRGRGLDYGRNEGQAFREMLLAALRGEPPIIRAGQQIAPIMLAAEACDALRAKRTEFKGPKWAVACVANWIRDARSAPVLQQTPMSKAAAEVIAELLAGSEGDER